MDIVIFALQLAAVGTGVELPGPSISPVFGYNAQLPTLSTLQVPLYSSVPGYGSPQMAPSYGSAIPTLQAPLNYQNYMPVQGQSTTPGVGPAMMGPMQLTLQGQAAMATSSGTGAMDASGMASATPINPGAGTDFSLADSSDTADPDAPTAGVANGALQRQTDLPENVDFEGAEPGRLGLRIGASVGRRPTFTAGQRVGGGPDTVPFENLTIDPRDVFEAHTDQLSSSGVGVQIAGPAVNAPLH